MPETRESVPSWLESSHNFQHLTTVLSTLAKRERNRKAARSASKHHSHPSKLHRARHIASSVQTNPEHVAYYSVAAGSDTDNLPFNRYSDIFPYDRTRVVVCSGDHEDNPCGSACQEGRYLNGNWVRELAGGKWWIAMQAPLPQTAHTFLSSLLEGVSPPPASDSSPSSAASPQPASNLRRERRIRTVVQLTKDLESGMRKAHAYFPPIVGQSWVVEPGPAGGAPIEVTLVRSQTIDAAHCVHSIVRLQPLSSPAAPSSPRIRAPVGKPVLFQHLLYVSWPDHGVPAGEDRMALLHFAKLVDAANRDRTALDADASIAPSDPTSLNPDPPIVAGCSAGVGRTGTFIALCSLLRHYGFLAPPGSGSGTEELGTQAQAHVPTPGPLPESPLGPLPEELQGDMIAKEIDALREQRPYMVERDDQVLMVYESLIAAFASASDANAKDRV
uniref:Putative Ptp2 n=1 Tax=Ganoderma lucidum TaxID=5315 RepID=A0A514YQS2_GANLU|nr:putative Ptp2 [Ganoderma lucidum]